MNIHSIRPAAKAGLRYGAEGRRAIYLAVPNAKEQRKSLGPRTRNSAPGLYPRSGKHHFCSWKRLSLQVSPAGIVTAALD